MQMCQGRAKFWILHSIKDRWDVIWWFAVGACPGMRPKGADLALWLLHSKHPCHKVREAIKLALKKNISFLVLLSPLSFPAISLLLLSVFRRHKYLICNSVCGKCFTIAFRVTDSSDTDKSDKRLCADHPSVNVFPRTAVGKLCGLSIRQTHGNACQCEEHGYVVEVEVQTRSS